MGGRFSFLNDSITGKVLEIVPNEKLVLSWRFSNWPADFFSNVQLFFTDNADSRSCLKLKHDNILSEDKERVSIGWPNIFFKPICRAFQIGPHNVQFSIF
uniref:Activator of 90 kDa heat shock protein ATPase homolog 1 (Trinotate prediction) n=1 Tax=Henneguya salminicola TaxID=69463 RepID=A0A6G3MM63_HENSL